MAVKGWEIEMLHGGLVDLRRDGRGAAYDLDMDEALDWARRQGADEVTIIELDGYRVKRQL